MPQKFHAGYDAILAKGKTADAVITPGTESPRALVTLDDRRILGVISAIQHSSLSFFASFKTGSGDSPAQRRSASVSAFAVRCQILAWESRAERQADRLRVPSNRS